MVREQEFNMSKNDGGGGARVELEIEPHDSGGEVAWVTLDHQARLNAANRQMIEAMITTFGDLSLNADLRVVVLTGAGERAFVGGADLNELVSFSPDSGREYITRLHDAASAIRNLPVPVIGRLRGYCLGAGAELAAACDFRVADESVVIGMPEVKVGLPSVIEAALFPDLIGWGKTREMMLTGMNYDAEASHRMGFVETLVGAAELDQTVRRMIDHICAAGPLAVRAQKALISEWERSTRGDAIAIGIDYLSDAYRSEEPGRLMRAFFDSKK